MYSVCSEIHYVYMIVRCGHGVPDMFYTCERIYVDVSRVIVFVRVSA
jgi:hypothetical protein